MNDIGLIVQVVVIAAWISMITIQCAINVKDIQKIKLHLNEAENNIKRDIYERLIERLETFYPEHACDGEQFDDGYGTAIHDCIAEIREEIKK